MHLVPYFVCHCQPYIIAECSMVGTKKIFLLNSWNVTKTASALTIIM